MTFKLLLSGVFALSGLPVYADGTPTPQMRCGQKLVNACQAKALAVGKQYGVKLASLQGGMEGNASGLSGSSAEASLRMDGIADECIKSANQCAAGCTVPEPQKKSAIAECQNKLKQMGADFRADAASLAGTAGDAAKTAGAVDTDQTGGTGGNGGSGGGMGMLGTAALAAGAGLLGYMMGKKGSSDDKNEDDGAFNPQTGQLNCSKDDAYEYMDCNTTLASACAAKINGNSYASDKLCQNFSNRFCASTSSSSSAVTTVAATANGPAKGGVGEGLSQNPGYCQQVLAFNFCQGSGRGECPSCLQLVANRAPACANNPALCLAQNSPEQLNQAKQTCPTDPVFSNPNMITGGQVATGISGGAPLPVAVLPSGSSAAQVVNAGTSATGTTTATAGANSQLAATTGSSTNGSSNGTVVTFSTASVKGGASEAVAGGATREGGGGSQYASGGAGGSGMNPVGYGSRNAGNSREIAAAGGGAGNMRPSSVGPAPDVQGQFGPSVFAMGTQVIRQRCQAGKLNNCP